MYRQVTGKIGDIVENRMPGEVVIGFSLRDKHGSFTNQVQYPGQLREIVTDIDGNFTISLWVNTEGNKYSTYLCTFQNVFFEFEIPIGTEPISLSELRLRGITPEPIRLPSQWERLSVLVTGQTTFVLLNFPTEPQNAIFFVNGIKAIYAIDYVLDGISLRWLNNFLIVASDFLEIYYR